MKRIATLHLERGMVYTLDREFDIATGTCHRHLGITKEGREHFVTIWDCGARVFDLKPDEISIDPTETVWVLEPKEVPWL